MDVEPEWFGQDDFGKLFRVATSCCRLLRLWDYWFSNQFAQNIEVFLMCQFTLEHILTYLLIEHESYQLKFAISYNNHVYLLGYNLFIHLLIIRKFD